MQMTEVQAQLQGQQTKAAALQQALQAAQAQHAQVHLSPRCTDSLLIHQSISFPAVQLVIMAIILITLPFAVTIFTDVSSHVQTSLKFCKRAYMAACATLLTGHPQGIAVRCSAHSCL